MVGTPTKAPPQGGALLGKQWQPRDLAAAFYDTGWHDAKDLSVAVMVCLSESQGYERAYNDNLVAVSDLAAGQRVRNPETGELLTVVDPATGAIKNSSGDVEMHPLDSQVVTSRDVGLMQINIPALQIGTAAETVLYDPPTNLARAFTLWSARGFQPWVGWNLNVYKRDTYLKRANRGVANWLADLVLQDPDTDTLAGVPYVHTLTTPVCDYSYRVLTQHTAIQAADKMTVVGLRAVTRTLAQKSLLDIRDTLTPVLNETKV